MKYIALRPEQMIFDSEEAAVDFYKKPTENSDVRDQRIASGYEPMEKVLICTVECVRVLTPSVATGPGGDQHFVDYERAEAERLERAVAHRARAMSKYAYANAEDMQLAAGGAMLGGLAKQRLD